MLFASAFALVAAAAAASVARAQAVTINPTTLNQCATTPITFSGSTGPYYVAVLNAADLCGNALAEFYNVEGTSVDYLANVASGTQVQILVIDSSEQEAYSEFVTVGDGDAACLTGETASTSSSVSETPTPEASSYVPPARTTSPAAAMTYGSSNDDDSSFDDTPVNAQSDSTTSGASTITASASLFLGAIVAAAALF